MSQLVPYLGNSITWSDTLNTVGNLLFDANFIGVYTSDMIPKLNKRPSYCIVNLDTSNERGSHWVAVAKIRNGTAIVYDSFGRSHTVILRQLKRHFKRIKDTELDAEQTDDETNCGLRSMSWLCVLHYHGAKIALTI